MTMFEIRITRPGRATFAYARGLSFTEAKRAFADCIAVYGDKSDLIDWQRNSFAAYAGGLRISIA